MVDFGTLLIFLPAALLLAIAPGPDMVFCLGKALSEGRRAGIQAALGCALGGLSGILLVGFGLSELLSDAPERLVWVRALGITYLLWLTYRTLTTHAEAKQNPARTLVGGTLVSLANPKGAAFAFALVPQFISPDLPFAPQFLLLGGILTFLAFCANVGVCLLSERFGLTARRSPRLKRFLRFLPAGLYMALALRMLKGATS